MAEEKRQFKREVAKRMFVWELAQISQSYKKDEDNEFAPTYYLTPTGCEANRVLLMGVVTDIDDIGSDKAYYRAKVTDPTGEISVYAGEYNQDAASQLARLNIPAYVAIIGKINIYTPDGEDDADPIISIRAEQCAVVDERTYDLWRKETVAQTLARIEAMINGPRTTEMEHAIQYYAPDLETMKAEVNGLLTNVPPEQVPTEEVEEFSV